jgi:hypothetical protein
LSVDFLNGVAAADALANPVPSKYDDFAAEPCDKLVVLAFNRKRKRQRFISWKINLPKKTLKEWTSLTYSGFRHDSRGRSVSVNGRLRDVHVVQILGVAVPMGSGTHF